MHYMWCLHGPALHTCCGDDLELGPAWHGYTCPVLAPHTVPRLGISCATRDAQGCIGHLLQAASLGHVLHTAPCVMAPGSVCIRPIDQPHTRPVWRGLLMDCMPHISSAPDPQPGVGVYYLKLPVLVQCMLYMRCLCTGLICEPDPARRLASPRLSSGSQGQMTLTPLHYTSYP